MCEGPAPAYPQAWDGDFGLPDCWLRTSYQLALLLSKFAGNHLGASSVSRVFWTGLGAPTVEARSLQSKLCGLRQEQLFRSLPSR